MKFSLRPNSKPIRWLIRLAIITGVIGLLLWVLPVGLREGAEWWLAEQGVETEIEDINLNLFTGKAEITQARGENSQGDGFVIGRAYADLTWQSVIEGRVHLLEIVLADSKFDIRQNDTELVSVLGLQLADLISAEPKPEEETQTDIQYGLDKLQLSDVHIRWHAPDFSEDIKLDTGGVLDFASWSPDEPVPVDIHADIAGGSLDIRGELKPFAERVSADIQVTLQSLDTSVFAPLLRGAGIADLAGVVDTDTQVAFRLQPNGFDLQLSGPLAVGQTKIDLGDTGKYASSLNWQGKTSITRLGKALNLEIEGQLLASQSAMQQSKLNIENENIDWQGKVDVALDDAGQQIHALGKLKTAELKLDQAEGVKLTRLAPSGDIDAKVQIAADTGIVSIAHKLSLQSPAWQVALDEAVYVGESISVTTDGQLSINPTAEAESKDQQTAGSSLDTAVDLQLKKLALTIDPDTAVKGQTLKLVGNLQTALEGDFATTFKGNLNANEVAVQFAGGDIKQAETRWNGDVEYAIDGPGLIALQGKLGLTGTDLSLQTSAKKQDTEVTLTTALQQADAGYEGKARIVLPKPSNAKDAPAGAIVSGEGYLQLTGHKLSQEALEGPGLETAGKAMSYKGQWSASLNQPEAASPSATVTAIGGDGVLSLADIEFAQGSDLSTGVGQLDYSGPWNVRLQSVVVADSDAELPESAPASTISLLFPGPVQGDDLRWAVLDAKNQTEIAGTLDWLRWQGDIEAELAETIAYSAKGAFALRGLNLSTGKADNGLVISQQLVDWQGEVIQPASKTPAAPNASGELKTEGLFVKDRRVGRNLATLQALEVSGIKTKATDDIQVQRVLLTELAALERIPETDKQLSNIAQSASTELTQIKLSNLNRLEIGNAVFSGLRARLERIAASSEGETDWEFSEWLPKSEQPSTATENTPETSEETPFTFRIGRTTIAGDSRFTFKDQTVKPIFAETLKDIKLDASALDSADPELVSQLDVAAGIGRYGEITLVGPVQPFLERPSFDLKGKVNSVNLTSLSPYTALAIGHGVRQGTLNADLNLVSNRGELDSNAQLKLSKVKFEKSNAGKGLEGSLGMPLNQALSLLRDRNDNITLDLPITGDIENPDFSTGDVIRKAVLKAIQVAVLNYYSPLGVVFAADKLIDLATAVRFDPVTFDPAVTAIDKDDQEYLGKLSKLMTDRPGMEIVVCGYATPADRPARITEIEEAKGFFDKVGDIGDDRTPEEIVTDEDLLALADARSGSVIDYLIEQGIERSRIVACGAKLDSKADQKPRVEFSF